jgi:hypothetical protein
LIPARLARALALGWLATSGCWFRDYHEVPDVDAGLRGPIAWWKLDEGTGPTAADASGNGHTGTLQGGAVWAPGHSGSGISFDGMAALVDAGTSDALQLTGSLTITAWIFPRTYGGIGLGRIVNRRNGEPGGYALILDAGITGFELVTDGGNPGEYTDSNRDAIQLGAWQHVAATYDPVMRLATLYVGGVGVGAGILTDGPGPVSTHLLLGSREGAGETFDGVIDDVRIYDRALSPTEIRALATQ